MQTIPGDWNEILVGEMIMCSLLGRAFYEYPKKEWLQSLIDEDVFSETPFGAGQPEIDSGIELLQKWSAQNRTGISQAEFDEIEADYVHLFIGTRTIYAAPWESVYLNKDKLMFQIQTLQVRNWYRRFQLQAENLYHEPDDHIGIELSFLAQLARLALQALETDNSKRFHNLLKAQSEFIRTHPARWVHLWSKDVELNAHADFFVGMARVTSGVIHALEALLKAAAPEEVKKKAKQVA